MIWNRHLMKLQILRANVATAAAFSVLLTTLGNAQALPFQVLDIRDENACDLYGFELILLRPDLHVAWRSNRPPLDPARLARLVTGH
jgi:hypothetical protein